MMQQRLQAPVIKDPVAEAAERAKKEAEAQRLADVRLLLTASICAACCSTLSLLLNLRRLLQ